MLEPEKITEFSAGDKIYHDKFGAGEILEIKGKGYNLKASILFDSAGKKIIVLSYAKLKRIL